MAGHEGAVLGGFLLVKSKVLLFSSGFFNVGCFLAFLVAINKVEQAGHFSPKNLNPAAVVAAATFAASNS